MDRLALPAPKPQLLLPAPTPDRQPPVYPVLRVGKFYLPGEPKESAMQMAVVLGVYHSQEDADHVASTCKPHPNWFDYRQYTDISRVDEPAVDGI